MEVELRNHPAQAVSEGRLPDGTVEIAPLVDADGKPVPLFPDQHGIYYRPNDKCMFVCVGYCLKRPKTPVCLIENFAAAEAEFIRAEVAKGRGGPESKFAMISQLEAEPVADQQEPQQEESPIIMPSTFARDGEDDE